MLSHMYVLHFGLSILSIFLWWCFCFFFFFLQRFIELNVLSYATTLLVGPLTNVTIRNNMEKAELSQENESLNFETLVPCEACVDD